MYFNELIHSCNDISIFVSTVVDLDETKISSDMLEKGILFIRNKVTFKCSIKTSINNILNTNLGQVGKKAASVQS